MKAVTPYVVGIVGPSGAGKSTLCNSLAEMYGDYQHIRLDNYFKSPRTFANKGEFANWERAKNLKFKDIIRHVKTLKRGKSTQGLVFDKRKQKSSGSIELLPKRIIVVEGFLLLKNKELRDLFDLTIFLDIHPELMIERRAKKRFSPIEYEHKVLLPEYLKNGIVQKKYADFLVDATKTPKQVLKKVHGLIEKEYRKQVK